MLAGGMEKSITELLYENICQAQKVYKDTNFQKP